MKSLEYGIPPRGEMGKVLALGKRIAPESALLAAICLADLLSTLWLVYAHGAKEANPIMAFYLALGPIAFALVKTLTFMSPIFVLEILRQHRPESIRAILRLAIVCYLICYSVGIWHVNSRDNEVDAADNSYQADMAQTNVTR